MDLIFSIERAYFYHYRSERFSKYVWIKICPQGSLPENVSKQVLLQSVCLKKVLSTSIYAQQYTLPKDIHFNY
jgi:hypothetical protein